MRETNRIELKSMLTDGLEKEVVAFLNYREGGVIYIGIEDDGKVIGVENTDDLQLRIKDRLKNNIHPTCLGLFDILEEELEGKSIVKIIVASGPEKPYYIKRMGMSEKGCYIRVGTAAEPMTNRLIENLFARRTRNSIGRIRSNQQTLRFEQLRIYYEESGKKLNSKYASNLGLKTDDDVYNYVAFLMSDVNSVSVKVAKYKGKTRVNLTENNEFGYCSIIKATKQVLDKLELENKTRSRITSTTRIDTRLWHNVALREAVINAFVHNDYTNEVPPKFEIFDDRLEITSAGGLPENMSQEEFFEGFSMPRNQEMMRIFKDLDLVEHLGSGIPRILDYYPKSCFRFTENFLRMTIPNAWDLTEEEIDSQEIEQIGVAIDGANDDAIGGAIGGAIELTEKQIELLAIIFKNPRIPYREIALDLNINESAVLKHLKVLKKKGALNRIGGTRGYWQVTGHGKDK